MDLEFEGQTITVREDGYWDATQMCQGYGKRINDFLRLKSTKEYLKALSDDLEINSRNGAKSTVTGIPATVKPGDLVDIRQGGTNFADQRTYVHEEVALKLAAWLNPKFEVWVFRVIKNLLTQGEVKLKDELAALREAFDQKIEEYDLALALTQHDCDRYRYELDEIREVVDWRKVNCFQGADQ